MSKRFTDITIWRKPWFRRLPPTKKLILKWLFDNCDRAGYLEIDEDRLWFDLGEKPIDKPFEGLKDVVIRGETLWIIDFCEFQYPGGLSDTNRAHTWVIERRRKMLPYFEGATKGLTRALQGRKEKEEEKEKALEEEKEGGSLSPLPIQSKLVSRCDPRAESLPYLPDAEQGAVGEG